MLVVADDLSGAVEVASVLGARRIALGHADVQSRLFLTLALCP